MNNINLAEGYLREAKIRLKYAEEALKVDKDYAYCVRSSQEVVELSVKAILRLYGLEVPKTHDPGRELVKNKEKFPEWLKNNIGEIEFISRWLSLERIPSFYGDEETGTPPNEIYDEEYCKKALESANYVYQIAEKALNETKERFHSYLK
ncbi:HEPN domain-containing protein [Sulfurisphaera javensis]|uniref:HEPN domain-containing protein n=1 Tax=Sulfurisphaera javensis TaxID=2049879 RepID=UPI0034E8DF9A